MLWTTVEQTANSLRLDAMHHARSAHSPIMRLMAQADLHSDTACVPRKAARKTCLNMALAQACDLVQRHEETALLDQS